MGVDLSEGFPEEGTSQVGFEEQVGAFLQMKGGEAAATE